MSVNAEMERVQDRRIMWECMGGETISQKLKWGMNEGVEDPTRVYGSET